MWIDESNKVALWRRKIPETLASRISSRKAASWRTRLNCCTERKEAVWGPCYSECIWGTRQIVMRDFCNDEAENQPQFYCVLSFVRNPQEIQRALVQSNTASFLIYPNCRKTTWHTDARVEPAAGHRIKRSISRPYLVINWCNY